VNQVVAIVGPTGVGKSRLAIQLALKFKGEIVGADSRQIYRYMDIGTAKPSQEELAQVPHHLVDIINPNEDFNLAQYQQMAYSVIADIQHRNKLPLLVGGSGLYVRAVLEGWQVPEVAPDTEFRRQMEEKAKLSGPAELQQELMRIDPTAAENIDPRNIRRLIRALEVYKSTGTLFSELQLKRQPNYDTLIVGLTADRDELYRRVDARVNRMVEQGLIEEVERLINMEYSLDLPSMSGIGYRQIGLYLKGEITLTEAIQQIKFETHRFVRHQYNWFRLKDPKIKWFDITHQPEAEITALVGEFLGKD
jgi:tRNA dimethylallyltransferase